MLNSRISSKIQLQTPESEALTDNQFQTSQKDLN